MAQLWVVRHGQASLFSTDYDVLSEVGEAQARALGKHLAEHRIAFDRVFTGPAKRQRDTARLAGEALGWPEATLVEGLDEHDAFGMMNKVLPKLADDPNIVKLQEELSRAVDRRTRSKGFQRIFEAVMTRWLDGQIDPEDAETWEAFRNRVLAGLQTLSDAAPGAKRIIAFTSVGPLSVLIQHALRTSDLESFRTGWRIRNASITRFEYSRGRGMTLDGFNSLPHLPDPDTWTFR